MGQKNKNKVYVLDKSKFSSSLKNNKKDISISYINDKRKEDLIGNKNNDDQFEVHEAVRKMHSWNSQDHDPRKTDDRLKKITELKEMSQSFVNSIDELEKSRINFESNKKIEQEIINENKRLEKEHEKKLNFFKNLKEKNQKSQEVYSKEFEKDEVIKLIDKK